MSSGQPSVEKGQSPEENQVSSTSGSCCRSRAAAVRAAVWRRRGHDLLAAVRAVPHRDAVAPPELARDAPVADVLHPVEVDLVEALRDDPDAPVAHRVDGRLGQRLDLDEPLRRDARLDDRVAALAVADGVDVLHDLDQQALALQVLDDAAAALGAIQAGIRARRPRSSAPVGHDIDRGQIVALADLVVGRVVRGRHLDRAGAERRVHRLVGDDRDDAPEGRQDRLAPDQPAV